MKIRDILKEKSVTISCEIFPPKKDADFEGVVAAARGIAALRPDFISVTYGASGGTSQNTVKIASMIQQEMGVTSIAHLTCASSTREQVREVIGEIRSAGVENILALRGDIPTGADFPVPNQSRYASELTAEIRAGGDFCIGGACYPEGHVECASREEDLDHLKAKVDMGCDFLTTQMFFDNSLLYRFLYRAMAHGITVPVLAGIMPVTNSKQIRRITQLSGTQLPMRFLTMLDKFGDNPAAMKQAGIAYATEQIIDLISNGVRGIHLYTMNKPDIAAAIFQNLSHVLGREEA